MEPKREIVVRGARQHNLKNVDVAIPRDKLVVITGPSGSGKSSLAFDTIYAEGQRRYVDSLSAYARQFLENLQKPDVDSIEGLSPAISLEQQAPTRNPRSTVGTVTEVYDHLRLLFARIGKPHCPKCGRQVAAQSVNQMVDLVLSLPAASRFSVQAPLVRGRKGEFKKELQKLRKDGFTRVAVDGVVHDLSEEIPLDKNREHTIDVFVDRLAVKPDIRARLADSIELALKLAGGLVRIAPVDGEDMMLSERFACPDCAISLPEITPRLFSFNSPTGACTACGGIGEVSYFDAARIVDDPSLSIARGAVLPWGKAGGVFHKMMVAQAKESLGVDVDTPWGQLSAEMRAALIHGRASDESSKSKKARASYEGILPSLERRRKDYERRARERGASTNDTIEFIEEEFNKFTTRETCTACEGARLRPEALAVRIEGENIRTLAGRTVREAVTFFEGISLSSRDAVVAERIVREILTRLRFLLDVGLDYLSLGRSMATLSGGEAERIRLATQIGAGLVGVLYVLDEPSIGLHPRDNRRLIDTLLALRDRGNTVLVVEHDAETMLAADQIVDMGPGAGRLGGRVVAQGTPAEVMADAASVTGPYLKGSRGLATPTFRRTPAFGEIEVQGAKLHNLAGVDAKFPLGVLTCVTGVSGSGKSSLVIDTLLSAAQIYHYGANRPKPSAKIVGLDLIDKVVDIDQSPIGRTPRSNPATYTGAFTLIRELFASLPDARARGYDAGRFSFNVKGGRCEPCKGDGLLRIEMHFLPDVYVTCEECNGRRYGRETLEVQYRGLNIADVLALSVDDALETFAVLPKLREKLEGLSSVGLGYLELGQSATTLSGGEAQRVKLARELAKRATGKTLYVLDEPTTGLHFADVEMLVGVLQELVSSGNTVIVIEHNLDVVRMADYVIDLGPEGGTGGGRIIATGTPEEIAKVPESHTGRFLAPLLAAR